MSNDKLEFLYRDEKTGFYFYRNHKGKEFKSHKKLHTTEENDDETVEIKDAKKFLGNGEINVDALVENFNVSNKSDTNRAPGAHVAEAFKETLSNLKDKDVTDDDLQIETRKLVSKLEQAGIIFQVGNNPRVQKKVLENSETKLFSEMETGMQKQKQRLQDATFDANQDALENAGLRKGSPLWLIRLAKITSGFWSVIIVIVSFFTVTPIVMISKSLGVQIKTSPLKWVLTVLLYISLILVVFAIVANAADLDLPSWLEWLK